MNEFKELIKKASKAQDSYIDLLLESDGQWSLSKRGAADEDVDQSTFEECIAKLKEWATPPKPEFVTIRVPYDHAADHAKYGSILDSFVGYCQEAIKPYEV